MSSPIFSLQQGVAVITEQLKHLPSSPGVYRMLSAKGEVLYVGKAKNLAKRVVAYTQIDVLPYRLQQMVAHTASMEIITTRTETEALLLEANLIKHLKPRYNILLKDDKSFPYILLTEDHSFSQITKHRGERKRKGQYFGPFISAGNVDEALVQLQKMFLLRSCSDSMFESRKRPCILYQIKRCSGPCVGKISKEDYDRLAKQATDFLGGKTANVQKQLQQQMEEASNAMDYERAAGYRDRIRALNAIQANQAVQFVQLEEADVIGLYQEQGLYAVQVFFVRGGRLLGNQCFFPAHTETSKEEEVLAAFIAQFYQSHPCPRLLLLSHILMEKSLLEEALKTLSGHKVECITPKTGDKHTLLMQVIQNAKEALLQKMAREEQYLIRMKEVAALFHRTAPVERIEVYDNSHIMGTHAVGAMIVARKEGFAKKEYRHFNITFQGKGDDYRMLQEVLLRRFRRLLERYPEPTPGVWPDIVLIDGGAGHLAVGLAVQKQLELSSVTFAAIAKGPERNAGKEQFFLENREAFTLDKNIAVMKYLQQLRDEAHRFAITTHRKKRSKALVTSELDTVPGIGAKRKKALLTYFGSVNAIKSASVEELMQAEGINKSTAQKLFFYFHSR